jgi:Bacterial protein of unknown function (DUF885)
MSAGFESLSAQLVDTLAAAELDEWSRTVVAQRVETLNQALAALDAVDLDQLTLSDAVDLELLRDRTIEQRWSLAEDRPNLHDPLVHLPVAALRRDLAGDVGSLSRRLALLPDQLAGARRQLRELSPEHVAAAASRCAWLQAWLADHVPAIAAEPGTATSPTAQLLAAAAAADTAVASFARWLRAKEREATRDPRLGPLAYQGLLWHRLDCRVETTVLRTRIESDLQEVEEELAELAARLAGGPPGAAGPGGQVADLLAKLSAQAALPDGAAPESVTAVLTEITARARELDLVVVPDLAVRLVGRADRRARARWTPCGPAVLAGGECVVTLPAEGDLHALRLAAVHAVLPGHVFAAAHRPRHPGRPGVRELCRSDVLREGWAGFAEDLLAGSGIGLRQHDDDALRLQALLSRLRGTVAALVDLRAHSDGLTRAEGLALLTGRGHLGEADADAAWRQSMLTPGLIMTRYLGRREVHDVVRRLGMQRPRATESARHEAVLDHGPVPPRLLRLLLGLDE